MEEQLNAVIRRLESVEKTLNLIYKDRDILEETHVRVGTLQDEIKLLQERVAKLEKRLSADVSEMSDKIDDVKEALND